jgi:hypothetical protein
MGLTAHPWSIELIESWSRLCREVGAGFVEHLKAFRHRWITFRLLPLPHLEADLRWWHDLGAGGFNAPQEGEGWWVKHLNSYVLARLMWDLDESVEALLDDYFSRYWSGIGPDVRRIYEESAAALPNLSYSRNQPALLPNRSPGVRLPPEEQWAPDIVYLERAIEKLASVRQRVSTFGDPTTVEPLVQRRLAKLDQALEGACASLAVSLAIRRYLIARGTSRAAAVAREARAAHDAFAAVQTPDRIAGGTLWTGRWRRDETFAAWEREASAVTT